MTMTMTMTNVRDKIENGEYVVPAEFRIFKGEARKKAMVDYQKKVAARGREFRSNALEYVGLTGHPKADKAFDMAWDRSHSSGLSAVVDDLEELAELLV